MPLLDSVYVHPTALCESQDIGRGTRIWAFTHVMQGAHVGSECNLGDHTFVESGAYIGDRVTIKNQVLIWKGIHIEDDVFVGPMVLFTNDRYPRSPRMAGIPEVTQRYADSQYWLLSTRVGSGASIGGGAIIAPGIMIGVYAMVAAGTVVTHNVTPHQLIVGNPGRAKGWVCFCGQRLDQSIEGFWVCAVCSRKFQRTEQGFLAPGD